MRRPLITLLIALVLAASSFTPLCEIRCWLAPEGTAPVATLASVVPGHCHDAAGESGNDGQPSNPHPCKKGIHHRAELSDSPAKESYVPVAFESALLGVFPGMYRAMVVPTPGEQFNSGDSGSLPFPRIGISLLLRV
jgi:hypothetical protein